MIEVEIPGFIRPETWEAFCEVRRIKGTRAPLTLFAAQRIIAKLVEFDRQGYDADEILATSAERGWTGVFLLPDTPRRNKAVEASSAYLATLREYKASKPTAEIQQRLALVKRGA